MSDLEIAVLEFLCDKDLYRKDITFERVKAELDKLVLIAERERK